MNSLREPTEENSRRFRASTPLHTPRGGNGCDPSKGHFVAINQKGKLTAKDMPNPHVDDAKPKRSHLIAEFDAVFTADERWKPEVFTPELSEAFLEAIFYHRPTKPVHTRRG